MKRAIVTALFVALSSAPVRAEEPAPDLTDDPAVLFRDAADALAGGRPADAVAKLEALGDRGVVDPVVSYDRGLAYAERVRTGAERPGDLGHAAHGFEEAKRLTRDSALREDAARALAAVRAEIARRRARAGDTVDVEHGASLGRSIVDIAHENVWAALAAVFSFVLAAGIVARARSSASRARVAASTVAGISGALFAIAIVVSWIARDTRRNVTEGVVVAPDVRLFDQRRLALEGAAPVAEGTLVRILDESAGFTHVSVAGVEGWLPQHVVLPLAKR